MRTTEAPRSPSRDTQDRPPAAVADLYLPSPDPLRDRDLTLETESLTKALKSAPTVGEVASEQSAQMGLLTDLRTRLPGVQPEDVGILNDGRTRVWHGGRRITLSAGETNRLAQTPPDEQAGQDLARVTLAWLHRVEVMNGRTRYALRQPPPSSTPLKGLREAEAAHGHYRRVRAGLTIARRPLHEDEANDGDRVCALCAHPLPSGSAPQRRFCERSACKNARARAYRRAQLHRELQQPGEGLAPRGYPLLPSGTHIEHRDGSLNSEAIEVNSEAWIQQRLRFHQLDKGMSPEDLARSLTPHGEHQTIQDCVKEVEDHLTKAHGGVKVKDGRRTRRLYGTEALGELVKRARKQAQSWVPDRGRTK